MRPPIFAMVALAAHPSVAAVYDRAITVFSPDGKLMQVAYAEEAVKKGSLAVAASNGRDAIVMCLERPTTTTPSHDDDGDTDASPSPSSASTLTTNTNTNTNKDTAEGVGENNNTDDDDHDDDDHAHGRRNRHNNRFEERVRDPGFGVGIVDSANNQDRKLCEIDEGIYLAFAGMSADGRVLASKIRLECQSYRYSMGAAPSVGYIARYVGGLQHRYTRTGGARPYGVACLVAGFDEDTLLPGIFRSEPSGAFAEWTASAVGKASDKALGKLELVQDLSALDWRGTADAAVRAALAGGAKECDVLVLRRKVDDAGAPAPAPAPEEAPPQPQPLLAETTGEGEGSRAGGARAQAQAQAHAQAWAEKGWRDSGKGAWSKRFRGSVGRGGVVALAEEEEGGLAVPTRGG